MRIAIVIPWFGRELSGGAERQAYELARHLVAAGVELTVLTTCCRQFTDDWAHNHYQPGAAEIDGLRVLRFPVGPRNGDAFDRTNRVLLSKKAHELVPGRSPLSRKQERTFVNENISSPALLDHLLQQRSAYDYFLFIPYLYGPILKGIELVKYKAVLQPCLHDEPYAYLDSVAGCFHAAAKLFFNSDGEFELAKRLYGPRIVAKSRVVGEGIAAGAAADPAPGQRPLVAGKYVLSLGRRDKGKNTHLLIEAFNELAGSSHGGLKLVLAGPLALPVPPRTPAIVDLGLVSEADKRNLLRHCLALINPSTNESFSRVIFEAWLAKRPVVVNGNCLATLKSLEAAGDAGWAIYDKKDLIHTLREIESASEGALQAMGEAGHAYAVTITRWANVIRRYKRALDPERGFHSFLERYPSELNERYYAAGGES